MGPAKYGYVTLNFVAAGGSWPVVGAHRACVCVIARGVYVGHRELGTPGDREIRDTIYEVSRPEYSSFDVYGTGRDACQYVLRARYISPGTWRTEDRGQRPHGASLRA